MPRTVTTHAPAKLNLALSVGPPIAEHGGRHPIASWMVTVDLVDELTLTRLEPGVLSRFAILWHKDAKRRSEINWSLTKDLAVRAHQALERHIGRVWGLPVQMKLEKRIPVGGGLGGGSANAAAMLLALNELFELGLSREELAAVGSTLGSDVPFLVHGGSAIVEGVGDRIERHPPHESIELHAVIAFPEAACATPRVYSLFDERCDSDSQPAMLRADEVRKLAAQRPRPSHESLFNDLAEAAMLAAPRLRDDLEALSKLAERKAHVTGSGSSLFVLCDDPMHAAALADACERELSLPAVAARSMVAPPQIVLSRK